MTNVIRFRPTRPHDCPPWCSRTDHADSDQYHRSDFIGHMERDGDGAVTFALGGRVMTLVNGQRPAVEILCWASEHGIVTTQENHPITPIEARKLAGALLRLADEAEGRRGATS